MNDYQRRRIPKHILETIARRKKRGHTKLPPLSAIDKVYPTWHGIFIGYNLKMLAWKKFLTPKEISLIAEHNGFALHSKNVSLAFGGRMLNKKDYIAICFVLGVKENIPKKNIAKKENPVYSIMHLLHETFNWDKFLGPMNAEDKQWCKTNFKTIARYGVSRHLPTAMKIVERRHLNLSKRMGLPISENSVFK